MKLDLLNAFKNTVLDEDKPAYELMATIMFDGLDKGDYSVEDCLKMIFEEGNLLSYKKSDKTMNSLMYLMAVHNNVLWETAIEWIHTKHPEHIQLFLKREDVENVIHGAITKGRFIKDSTLDLFWENYHPKRTGIDTISDEMSDAHYMLCGQICNYFDSVGQEEIANKWFDKIVKNEMLWMNEKNTIWVREAEEDWKEEIKRLENTIANGISLTIPSNGFSYLADEAGLKQDSNNEYIKVSIEVAKAIAITQEKELIELRELEEGRYQVNDDENELLRLNPIINVVPLFLGIKDVGSQKKTLQRMKKIMDENPGLDLVHSLKKEPKKLSLNGFSYVNNPWAKVLFSLNKEAVKSYGEIVREMFPKTRWSSVFNSIRKNEMGIKSFFEFKADREEVIEIIESTILKGRHATEPTKIKKKIL